MQMIRLICIALLCVWLGGAAQAAPPLQDSPARTISMDFKNADIQVLIKFMSELTGRNFIVDKRVAGRVTAYSPSKLSIEEAYKAFESILLVNDFTIVSTNVVNEYKVVPVVEARRMGIPVKAGRYVKSDASEELITQIIPLKNSSAPELSKLLVNMTDKNGLVSVYNPTNTLIITAPAANIESILAIIREVDKSVYAPQMETFPLTHGDAKTVATSIGKIMSTKIKELERIGKKAMALVEADIRTNSVVALGDPSSLETISSMIKALDIPTPKGKDDIHIMSLENADAEDVAKILNDLIARQVDKDGKATKLSKNIKLVADKATNSIIITARPDEFATIKGTVEQLDVLRKQVYIEALIMEVGSDTDFSFGVNWAGGASGGDTSAFVSSNNGGGGVTIPDAPGDILGFPSGGSVGAFVKNAINIGGTPYSIQAIINLAETSNDYTILATPQLLTLDNEKATVNVVDNIPFSTQTQTNNTSSDYNSQSLDYKDVGVKLEITPHIGEKGTLRLELKQEVSRVTESVTQLGKDGPTVIAPTTKKREVETVIQMQDNQTAVIAGLINDDSTNSGSKVPGAGDIPLFGWLFKQKEEKSTATNLFIFITPRIIDTYDESTALARMKRQSIHDVSLGQNGKGMPKMIMADPVIPVFVFPERNAALVERDFAQ